MQDLDVDIVQKLIGVATRIRCKAGTLIFSEGEPTAGLFLIDQGTIKISRSNKDGREITIHLLERGATFNDVPAMDGGPNPATATAQTDVILWNISRIDLQNMVTRHPALAWALVGNIAQRTRQLVALVQDHSLLDVRGRLAKLLLEQAERAESDEVLRLMTQEEMASRLGTVREVVGRTLRNLAANGIIEFDRHRIVILDVDKLKNIADM